MFFHTHEPLAHFLDKQNRRTRMDLKIKSEDLSEAWGLSLKNETNKLGYDMLVRILETSPGY
jgi:hypothetical protein